MSKFIATYVSQENSADAVGEVIVDAGSSREAGRIALSLQLPLGADQSQVHISPCDLNAEAGFEIFEKVEER